MLSNPTSPQRRQLMKATPVAQETDLTGITPPEPSPNVEAYVSPPSTDQDATPTSPAPTPSPTTTTQDSTPSIAGLSHSWPLKTRYYTATIPIWIDEISAPAEWAADFTSPAAEEVLGVVGAWVVCFRKPIDREGMDLIKACLRAVSEVSEHGGAGDGALLAVAMPQSIVPCLQIGTEEWEDMCRELGNFEYIDAEATGKNEFGEVVGIERAREALEANDWEGEDELLSANDLGLEEERENEEGVISGEAVEVWREMFGLRESIVAQTQEGGSEREGKGNDEDDEEVQVDKLEAMMRKMMAVKDMGAGMSEADRRRLAARTVNEIMGSL
ncbi:MAG: hypothetical protein M4579_006879 [Chaenotheca gracillima]|nr:MAG: hypothetical protein M4579_006879 [Chaenotheca gracillima]